MGSDYKQRPFRNVTYYTLPEKLSSVGGPVSSQTDILGETDFVHLDVYENKEEIVVEVDLPGLSLPEITVKIHGGAIIIEAVKKEPCDAGEKIHYLCAERRFGIVRRMVKFGVPVNQDAITAAYKEGVLVIRAPKLSERRNLVRRISIQGAEE